MTYGRVIVRNEYPQADGGKPTYPAEPSEYAFLVANSAYPEQGLGDLIVELLKGAVDDFNEGLNGAANEMVGELFRQISADFGPEEVHFDDPNFGVSYTYILAPFDRPGCSPEWKIVALYAGDPKRGGLLLTKDDANHGPWVEENVASDDGTTPASAGAKKTPGGKFSGRNYRRMGDAKLKQCIKELEAKDGDAYERCIAKGSDPAADLVQAKSILAGRGPSKSPVLSTPSTTEQHFLIRIRAHPALWASQPAAAWEGASLEKMEELVDEYVCSSAYDHEDEEAPDILGCIADALIGCPPE